MCRILLYSWSFAFLAIQDIPTRSQSLGGGLYISSILAAGCFGRCVKPGDLGRWGYSIFLVSVRIIRSGWHFINEVDHRRLSPLSMAINPLFRAVISSTPPVSPGNSYLVRSPAPLYRPSITHFIHGRECRRNLLKETNE